MVYGLLPMVYGLWSMVYGLTCIGGAAWPDKRLEESLRVGGHEDASQSGTGDVE